MSRLTQRRKELLHSLMKEAIYEAAVEVLTEHGIVGMTMDRVAEKAGIAKGSLYKYFPNKIAMLQFIHKTAVEPVLNDVHDLVEKDMSAVEKLELLIETLFEYLDKHRGLFHFFTADITIHAVLKADELPMQEASIKDLATIIRQGIAEKAFRSVDADQVANFLFGAIRHTCDMHLSEPDGGPNKQLTSELARFFIHGLATQNNGDKDNAGQ